MEATKSPRLKYSINSAQAKQIHEQLAKEEHLEITDGRLIKCREANLLTIRLADALEVAVEALNVYAADENYYNGTAKEALAKIEQIAKGERDDQ